jgi:hypothetical protein
VAVERTGKTVMDRGVERDIVLLSVGAGQRVHSDTFLAVAVTDLGTLDLAELCGCLSICMAV